MQLDLERIRKNVRETGTEELLDRITAYRPGMEPAAIEVIEAELERRGIGEVQVREETRGVDAVIVDEAIAVLTLEEGRLAGHIAADRLHQSRDVFPRPPTRIPVTRKECLATFDDLARRPLAEGMMIVEIEKRAGSDESFAPALASGEDKRNVRDLFGEDIDGAIDPDDLLIGVGQNAAAAVDVFAAEPGACVERTGGVTGDG